MANVQLDQVRKTYENGHIAVVGATFEVQDAELLVLVGPSGCGKSTLLRMIAGLESVTSGTLSINGRVVNDVAPKDRDIAMVFQNYALYPHMTVAENLGFGLKLRGASKADARTQVGKAAEMLGLTEMLPLRPRELSGGQRQRVALGRALVRDPEVFLLDEPLSNLDAKLRLSMRTEIAKLHRSLGTTMIYVTHDQIEAMTLGHRIVVMRNGEIQQIDTPMYLYDKPANMFVAGFLGSPAMNFFRGRLIAGVEPRLQMADGVLPLGNLSLQHGALAKFVDQEIVLGVRPEDLHLRMTETVGQSGGSLRAQLEVIEPVGNEIFLNMRSGSSELVARIPPQILPTVGNEILLEFALDKLHFFDAKTEQRIELAAR
ncbi:sn-glycerol-3-phosphate ABC transporter ATP-binding protein UgpC [Pseudolysobacter antarcticus]|uniref:sn-glycerol-3-phosphate ABC transporter ATP-binding protein UgpC n=1 Tax=Pseudolysobacter antarcticus TaxID=2511995 RepID=A0A411HJV7_9GAMM|nr:sn-glycerol-3-phosphate ABC transporter ATP-binding protein UgpC [Pseudolysobacter antarcticus]QBB70778.1 sn-glycerol-3-phosphate ABC transporter ATP-binding protein UgpC [Pseudolysobacter antarcticus]